MRTEVFIHMYQFINVTSPSFLFIIHLGNEPTLGMVLRSDVSINMGHTVIILIDSESRDRERGNWINSGLKLFSVEFDSISIS